MNLDQILQTSTWWAPAAVETNWWFPASSRLLFQWWSWAMGWVTAVAVIFMPLQCFLIAAVWTHHTRWWYRDSDWHKLVVAWNKPYLLIICNYPFRKSKPACVWAHRLSFWSVEVWIIVFTSGTWRPRDCIAPSRWDLIQDDLLKHKSERTLYKCRAAAEDCFHHQLTCPQWLIPHWISL